VKHPAQQRAVDLEREFPLSGGGFTFNGTNGGKVVSGNYTGPSGTTGGFATLSTSSGDVTTYCGSVFGSGNSANQVTGVFNIAVGGGTVSGTFSVPPYSGFINGQSSSASFSITYTDPVAGVSDTATAPFKATR